MTIGCGESVTLLSVDPVDQRMPGPRTLTFSDGSTCVAAKYVVRLAGVVQRVGAEREVIVREMAAVETPAAFERAARVLSSRERSTGEVLRTLSDDGFSADVARQIVVRLTELDLLNDERFTESWIRYRRGSGFGRRRIARELTAKGVSDSIVARSLSCYDDEDEVAWRAVRSVAGDHFDTLPFI